MKVNIHDAKTNLSKLIERALSGEEVIIAKAGKPVVRLEVVSKISGRELGWAKELTKERPGWEKPTTDAESDEFAGTGGL